MSLAWMTVDHRRVQPTGDDDTACHIRRCLRAALKRAIGFVTGLVLGLALLNLIQARAEQEIILDFTSAPASAEDSGLLVSRGDGPPARLDDHHPGMFASDFRPRKRWPGAKGSS